MTIAGSPNRPSASLRADEAEGRLGLAHEVRILYIDYILIVLQYFYRSN